MSARLQWKNGILTLLFYKIWVEKDRENRNGFAKFHRDMMV